MLIVYQYVIPGIVAMIVVWLCEGRQNVHPVRDKYEFVGRVLVAAIAVIMALLIQYFIRYTEIYSLVKRYK